MLPAITLCRPTPYQESQSVCFTLLAHRIVRFEGSSPVDFAARLSACTACARPRQMTDAFDRQFPSRNSRVPRGV